MPDAKVLLTRSISIPRDAAVALCRRLAAEFAAHTPYHYSSYDEEDEVAPRERPAVIILGSVDIVLGEVDR